MQQIEITELACQLPALLAAIAQGEEIIITEAMRPVAKLVKIDGVKTQRRPGSAAGLFKMAPDFNAPLDHFDEYYH
jgi:antitoxin (DNA-binding transcriptional repressor) of toxin-antitoxin stability system